MSSAEPAADYFPGLVRPAAPQLNLQADQGPVILIVVDALRPDRMTPYGFRRPTTPHLDKLADDGALLTHFFVNANWTRPSTASLLTGLEPRTHGVEADPDRLDKRFLTLAEWLEAHRVPTGAVVGNGNGGGAFGMGQGFGYYADTVKHWDGLPNAQQVVDLALPFVREHRNERFFLFLFLVDPHDPYHAPEPFEDMFVRDPSAKLIRSPHWELGRYNAAQIRRIQDTYDGAVRYTDQVLGSFFDDLKKLGVYDKSTIMVTADHGEGFGEHGAFLHSHHLYDEFIRVPFIVRAPKMSRRGVQSGLMGQMIDLFPTISAALGVAPPKDLPGIDLFAAMGDVKAHDDRVVVSSFNNFGIHRHAARSKTHKLIVQDPADAPVFDKAVGKRSLLPSVRFDEPRFQLFDLNADPMEKNDLFSKRRLLQEPWRRLLDVLAPYRQLAAQAKGKAPQKANPGIDPETEADLRALGYIQ